MRTTTGMPTGAIRVVRQYAAADAKLPSKLDSGDFDALETRDDIYSEYKAHRSAMPEDLKLRLTYP